MNELERVIKIIDWLIFDKKIKSRRELADIIDYTESSLSQILNGKVPLSERFIKKLSSVSADINEEWITNETGMMLKSMSQNNVNDHNIDGNNVTLHKTETDKFLEALKKSQSQLDKSQEQIDRLIGIIEQFKN